MQSDADVAAEEPAAAFDVGQDGHIAPQRGHVLAPPVAVEVERVGAVLIAKRGIDLVVDAVVDR